MPKYSNVEIAAIIIERLTDVASVAAPFSAETELLGSQAVIDSLGLVTLLVSLEEAFGGHLDLSSSFMDLGTVEGEENPFRTVRALSAHIEYLLANQDAAPGLKR
jgi:acyl carrier protein